MSIEANRQLVMHAYRMFKEGDFSRLLDAFTDDVEWISTSVAQIPFSGTYSGKAGVGEFLSTLGQSMEAQLFEPEEFIAEGDKVAVTGRSQWRVRENGVIFDDFWGHIFTVRDGKIARFRMYGNSAATAAALTAPARMDTEEVAASMAH